MTAHNLPSTFNFLSRDLPATHPIFLSGYWTKRLPFPGDETRCRQFLHFWSGGEGILSSQPDWKRGLSRNLSFYRREQSHWIIAASWCNKISTLHSIYCHEFYQHFLNFSSRTSVIDFFRCFQDSTREVCTTTDLWRKNSLAKGREMDQWSPLKYMKQTR